jgi:putative oxidoreductase
MSKKQVMIECVAALLIVLFLYASLSKFLDFKTFTGEMNNQPMPNSWTPFLVWIIPCSEVAIALALLFEYTRLLGLYASVVLMALFTLYTLVILLHFFSYIPCSCGGIIKKLTWRQHLVFNFFFVALSLFGLILQRSQFSKTIIITKNSFV